MKNRKSNLTEEQKKLLSKFQNNTNDKNNNTKNNSFAGGTVNYNKKSGYTIIDIEVNGKLYRIKRDFIKKTDNTKLNKCLCMLYEFINDKEIMKSIELYGNIVAPKVREHTTEKAKV